MDYQEEENDQIKNVISHKKSEFRVEIRRKKVQQDLQQKRLKTIHNSYQKQFHDEFQSQGNNFEDQQNGQSQYSNQASNNSNTFQSSNSTIDSYEEVPDILHIEENLNIAMTQLSEAHKVKDILQCQDIMKVLHGWVVHYVRKELVEVSQVLNLMIRANLHQFCTIYTSMKYLQHENLQIYAFSILAQMTSVINKQNLDEMVEKKLFNHFIEHLQHSKSVKIIDNLFHSMGNLAGDCNFGSFFCSELADRDIMSAILQIFELVREDEIEIFFDSFQFFLSNFIKNIPEIQREEVYQFTPLVLLMLKTCKTDMQKKYAMNCLQNIILYEPDNSSQFQEEDYSTLAWLIYDSPQLLNQSLILIGVIIAECNDDVTIKLLDNSLLISLVKVIESSQELYRFKAARAVSNIASIPEQSVQDMILDEKIFKPLMKSLVDDSSLRVKKELAFFVANLICSATAETIIILIEKKSILRFLEMIFSKFYSDIELIAQTIQGFCSLFKQITLFSSHTQFRKFMKEIQEIGLFDQIEQFVNHKNKDISDRAEGLYSQLQDHSLLSNKKEMENSPSRNKNMPISYYNSRNQIAELQIKSFSGLNIFMQQLQQQQQQQQQPQKYGEQLIYNHDQTQNQQQNAQYQLQFEGQQQNNSNKNYMMSE